MPLYNKLQPYQQQSLQPQQQRMGIDPRDIIKDVRIKNVEVEVIIERPGLAGLIEKPQQFPQTGQLQGSQQQSRQMPVQQRYQQMQYQLPAQSSGLHRTTNTQNIRTYPMQNLIQQEYRPEKKVEQEFRKEKAFEVEQERSQKPENEQERRSDRKIFEAEQDLRKEKRLEVEQERRQAPIQERDYEKRAAKLDQRPVSSTIGQQMQDQAYIPTKVPERLPQEGSIPLKRVLQVPSYVQPPTYGFIHKREPYNPTFLPKREPLQQFSSGYVPKKDWQAYLPQRSLYADQRNILNTAQRDIPQRDIQFNQRVFQRDIEIKREYIAVPIPMQQQQVPSAQISEKQKEQEKIKQSQQQQDQINEQVKKESQQIQQTEQRQDDLKKQDNPEGQTNQPKMETQKQRELRIRQEVLDRYMISQKLQQSEQKRKVEERIRHDLQMEKDQQIKYQMEQQQIEEDRRMEQKKRHQMEQQKIEDERRMDQQRRNQVEHQRIEDERKRIDIFQQQREQQKKRMVEQQRIDEDRRRRDEQLRLQKEDATRRNDEIERKKELKKRQLLEMQKVEVERIEKEALEKQKIFEERQIKKQQEFQKMEDERKKQEMLESQKRQIQSQQEQGKKLLRSEIIDRQKDNQGILIDESRRDQLQGQQKTQTSENDPNLSSPVQEQAINLPHGHERHNERAVNDPLYYQSGILPSSKHNPQDMRHQIQFPDDNQVQGKYYAGQQQPICYQQHVYQAHYQPAVNEQMIENQMQTGEKVSPIVKSNQESQEERLHFSSTGERLGGLNQPIMTGYPITSKKYQAQQVEKQHQNIVESQDSTGGEQKVGFIDKTKMMLSGLTNKLVTGIEITKAEIQSKIETKKADYYDKKESTLEEQAEWYRMKAEESRIKAEEIAQDTELKKSEQYERLQREAVEQAEQYKLKAEEARMRVLEAEHQIELKRAEQKLNKRSSDEDQNELQRSKEDRAREQGGAGDIYNKDTEKNDNKTTEVRRDMSRQTVESSGANVAENQIKMNEESQVRSDQPQVDQYRE